MDMFWFSQFSCCCCFAFATRTVKYIQPTSRPISSTVRAKVLISNEYRDTDKNDGLFTSGESL